MTDTFQCGHERTSANTTYSNSGKTVGCLTCKRERVRARRSAARTGAAESPVVRVHSAEVVWAKYPPPGEWVALGACRDETGTHAALFDPIEKGEGKRDAIERTAAAVRICLTCPVKQWCHAYAEENRLLGVWGGQYRSTTARREGKNAA